MDYRTESPEILKNFLIYHQAILGHSKKTVEEYFLDLRNFFRYLRLEKENMPMETPLDSISIMEINIDFIKTVQLTDVYNYMHYLGNNRLQNAKDPNASRGLSAKTRARKVATIRTFFKYLTNKEKLLSENPMQDLDTPRVQTSLPHYLNLEESIGLLEAVSGKNQKRDYCILCLFLNCGLRISELVGLNVTDVREDQLRVLGKGNKERMLYLNEACLSAISDWLVLRQGKNIKNVPALFITDQKRDRISTAAVHKLVKKYLTNAGLDSSQYSSHKLRHTAATLMLKNGVDVRTLQEVLGHENLNTTQIYTHVDNEGLRSAAKANPLAKVKNKNLG
ncbi:MAG: tyrosine-type recombinase/integrase [Eubacteriales bacterium]